MRRDQLIFIALMLVIMGGSAIRSQEDTASGKLADFLRTDWEVRTDTNEWQFTGKLVPVSSALQTELLRSFPKHRFTLAEMNFVGHLPPSRYPLIVITDADTSDVVAFIRQLNWGATSKSFKDIFSVYQAVNKDDLANRLIVLAKLIASTDSRGSVGKLTRKKHSLSIDLLWAGGTWRRLTAQFDRHLRITKMNVTNASGQRSFF